MLFEDSTWLSAILITGWLTLGCFAAGHAIMYKRDPRSSTIWLLVSFLLPIFGPWIYWVFGINRIKRRVARRFGYRKRPLTPEQIAQARCIVDASTEAVAHLAPLRTVADRVTRLPLLEGNFVEPLQNGEQTYPAMLEAIQCAEKSVTLASYIFDWDDVGREFVNAISKASQRGVKTHVLVDGIGALGNFSRMGRLLLKSGAEVASFFPLKFPLGRVRLNLRNHRKLLVIDGRVGFTGGMNISRRHYLDQSSPNRVEDLHFRITGPVVSEMQHAFTEDWVLATKSALRGPTYFNKLPEVGSAICRGISSGPDEDFEIIHRILQAALSAAQREIWIVTPYFAPTWPLISALAQAALRGVRITLILPSKLDLPYMKWVADAYLWQLLQHGIRVFRRPAPFVHTKLMIVDDRWVLLGSANLDRRSLRLNFEFNVEAYDVELARSLSTWLQGVTKQSQEVTMEEMDSRPMWRRLRDGIAKMGSPHL